LFQRVLGIILPVFSIILLGYFYARREHPDMTWVNRLNVKVLAPALIWECSRLQIIECVGAPQKTDVIPAKARIHFATVQKTNGFSLSRE
jgi:hypothetical protein